MTHDDEATAKVRIADLLRDGAYQVRQKLEPGTVARYAQAYRSEAPMPPVRAMRLPGGALILIDGWHRVAALESLREHSVECAIVDGNEREALWEAAKANLTHGLPLRRGEFRQVFRAYVRAGQCRKRQGKAKGPLKSYREIAAELGGVVSYSAVRRWMMQDFPRVAAQMAAEDLPLTTGGLNDLAGDPENNLAGVALKNLSAALVASRGVRRPDLRGDLVRELRAILGEVEAGGEFDVSVPF